MTKYYALVASTDDYYIYSQYQLQLDIYFLYKSLHYFIYIGSRLVFSWALASDLTTEWDGLFHMAAGKHDLCDCMEAIAIFLTTPTTKNPVVMTRFLWDYIPRLFIELIYN